MTFLRSKSNSSWVEIDNDDDAEIEDDAPTLNEKTVEQPTVERHGPETAMSSYNEEVVPKTAMSSNNEEVVPKTAMSSNDEKVVPKTVTSSYTEEIGQPIYLPKTEEVTSHTKVVVPTYLQKTAMSSYTEEVVQPIYLPKTVVASHAEDVEPTKLLRAWAANALKKQDSDPIDQDCQV